MKIEVLTCRQCIEVFKTLIADGKLNEIMGSLVLLVPRIVSC